MEPGHPISLLQETGNQEALLTYLPHVGFEFAGVCEHYHASTHSVIVKPPRLLKIVSYLMETEDHLWWEMDIGILMLYI